MVVQLPNGNTTQMSLEQYLDMTDDEFNELMWKTVGAETEDPFYDSSLRKKKKQSPVFNSEEEYIEEEEEGILVDVIQIVEEVSLNIEEIG